jgi:hypothetical protein
MCTVSVFTLASEQSKRTSTCVVRAGGGLRRVAAVFEHIGKLSHLSFLSDASAVGAA